LAADHRLLSGLSLLENVALAATVAGAERDVAEGRAHELLDLMELGEKWRSLPAHVPPAHRQLAALARAIANRPALLLADEPTARLDSAGRAAVVDVFLRLHGDGQSILLATHDEGVADAAPRVIAMRDGSVDERVPSRVLRGAAH
jgi:putative ABC transport system ATP-binding protein